MIQFSGEKKQVNRQLELVSAKGKLLPGLNEVFIHLTFASEVQWLHLRHTPLSTQHTRQDSSATQMRLINISREITQIYFLLILAQKYQHWILNKYLIMVFEISKTGLSVGCFSNMDTRKGQTIIKGEYCTEVKAIDWR